MSNTRACSGETIRAMSPPGGWIGHVHLVRRLGYPRVVRKRRRGLRLLRGRASTFSLDGAALCTFRAIAIVNWGRLYAERIPRVDTAAHCAVAYWAGLPGRNCSWCWPSPGTCRANFLIDNEASVGMPGSGLPR